MRIQRKKISASTRSIKAGTDINDMLVAFEDRLAELKGEVGVNSSTNVVCKDQSVTCDSSYINDSDYDTYYLDSSGIFGEPGETYSLGEIKLYWNDNSASDDSLNAYSTFDDWWADTVMYLEPLYD